MNDLFDQGRKVVVEDHYSAEADVVLFHGDCLSLLGSMPSGSVALAITSPPYNIGKEYEREKPLAHYLEEQEPVLRELHRVVAETGSICWQVGNYINQGEVFPLDIFYYELFKRLGMRLRNRIIWRFGHGLHASKRFSGRYETILWFSKGDKYVFNLDSVRVPSKYPGKRHFKGPKRGLPSCNPNGKNPADVWEVVAQDWEQGVWDIPNVKANHPEKTIHPCQFPIELVERCVLALTNEGDRVLDPYCGVGSALIAAIKNGRKGIGADKEGQYISEARRRVDQFLGGNLAIRPIGRPVHQPTGREKVSQIPIEWLASGKEEEK
jgi:adenine-specific DNA-methyltransferase